MQYNRFSDLWAKSVKELRNPPRGCALPWMPTLTEYMGGLRPHEVTLLCAPTGAGKTELLATLAAQLTMAGVQTFAAPVETGDVDFSSRVISTMSKKNLNHGLQISKETMDEIEHNHFDRAKKMPLFIANYDDRVQIEELKKTLEFAHQADGCQVALLDNLNFFLEVQREQDQIAEMDRAVHELVMFAKKKVRMHILLIVHPRKTDGGRVESEFDIKGSSTAVQECANVMLFNRPKPEHIEKGRPETHREIILKKLRKRGFYVNKPVWVAYANGHYSEVEGPPAAFSNPTKGQRYVPPGCD